MMQEQKLERFSYWMSLNSQLSESSIYKYTRAINTISNEMIEQGIIKKSLLQMNLIELDLAISQILNNEYFISKNLTGNHMYSSALKQFRYFSNEIVGDIHSQEMILEEEIALSAHLSQTEKQTIIRARVGQGKYRVNLMEKYEGRCIVTGVDRPQLLIASHIKPWAICDNEERVDTENGLLLCPNIDKLFDYGLITFSDSGRLYISSFVGEENIKRLNIIEHMQVDLRATKRLLSYLEYHRDVIFVK